MNTLRHTVMMNAKTDKLNNDVVKTTGTPRVTCASTTRVHALGVLFVYGVIYVR